MKTQPSSRPPIFPRPWIFSRGSLLLFSALAVASTTAEPPPESTREWVEYIARQESADEVRERFRKQGMPNTFPELFGPRPDDAGNGWLHLSETLASVEESFPSDGRVSLYDLLGEQRGNMSKNEWLAAAREIGDTTESRAIVSAVTEALQMPHWYPVREWEQAYELMIPEVSTFRHAAQILSLRHRLGLVGKTGEGPPADELQLLQVELARRIAEEPTLITFLTGAAVRLMPIRDAQWSLSATGRVPPTAPFDRPAWEERFTLALSGERLFGQSIFASIRSGNGPEFMDSLRGLYGPDDRRVPPLTRLLEAFVLFMILGEEDQYLKLMELQTSDLDPETIDAITDEFLSQRRISLMAIIVPTLSAVRGQIDKMDRATRGWEIAAALLESYEKSGTYPAEPPVDSAGFRYTLLDDGQSFRLQSADPDDSDNPLFRWTPPGEDYSAR